MQELYSKAGIGVPHEDVEVNDVVIFGVMVAEFLADFRHWATQMVN
jgi:glycogen(starch) synthase